MIHDEWDDIYKQREWGKYPPEELIRFIARRYYKEPDRKSVKILEVGCGPGANIWYLAREGFSVYGIDGSKTAINQANLRLKKENLDAKLTVGDIIKLPYENNFFDCVIDIECIYANTFADSIKIIEEICRVLKPGGNFFSKTFMEGMVKPGEGTLLKGEQHTYQSITTSGPLSAKVGIQRLTSENDIARLYSVFTIESIDYLIRSEENRNYEVREFLISCKK